MKPRNHIALALVVVAMSSILSLPAVLYFWQRPDVTGALSLVLSLGFFSAVLIMARGVTVQLLIGLPVMMLNLIETVHILVYGGLISLGGVEALLYVDPNEAREFGADHSHFLLLGALVIAVFFGLARAKKRLDDLPRGPRLLVSGAAVILPFGMLTMNLLVAGSSRDVYLPTRIVEHYSAYLGLNPLTHTASGVAAALGARLEAERQRETRDRFTFSAKRSALPPAEELYVLVIGESSRRQNWSLFGYRRSTTPHLAQLSDLILFTDAVSPATTTARSVALSLSFVTAEAFDLFYRTKSLISAFREVGFKTYWISNQGTHRSAVGNNVALLMGEADEVRTTNFGFWNSVLDQALLPEFDSVLRDPAPRKLVVLHTLGSHTNYRQRFPAGWPAVHSDVPIRAAHSNPDVSDRQASIIDDYDRSIEYTDWFLSEIIGRHRKTGQYGAVVYFSDHGQRLYDDRRGQKGHGFPDFKAYDVEIPLVVWTSEAFNTANPRKRSAIAANAARPVSTADLATSVLDLAAISVDGLNPTRSFFSYEHVEVRRRVVLSNGTIAEYAPASQPKAATSSVRGVTGRAVRH
jgi:glucan phosphoethanolaminetransferase (alkaline phosphatase superfamily)